MDTTFQYDRFDFQNEGEMMHPTEHQLQRNYWSFSNFWDGSLHDIGVIALHNLFKKKIESVSQWFCNISNE